MKTKSIKSLRKKAWKLLSEYVRRAAADKNGIVRCYTCGRPHYWTDTQCGHYIHGDSLDYEINNLRAQCVYCNKTLHGNSGVYCERLTKEIGTEEIERMRFKKNQVVKWNVIELEEIISTYTQALSQLREE